MLQALLLHIFKRPFVCLFALLGKIIMHKIQTYIVSKFEEVGDKIVILCFMVICLDQLSAYHHNFIY